MLPIIALALTLAAALLVALVADRMGVLRLLLRARPLRASAIAFAVTFGVMTAAALVPVLGCASTPAQRADRQKSLAAVVSRVDVARLLECAHYGMTKQTAACLGARALTEGLEEAIHQATTLAESAQAVGNPQAGAGDMDADQEVALAADLDASLDRLAVEIANANTLALAAE